ncbi:MAG TPA: hypothetical protein PKD18_02740, partial [Saprospiraceae bacterium]|nr:hypothetical protein [Saprospiraceae bacterium]
MSKLKQYIWILLLRLSYVLSVVFGSVMPKILYWFLSRLIHYRKRVIDDNLLKAGIANLENVVSIRNAYYKQLANYVVESVYGLYATFAKLEQKIRFINIDLLESFLADAGVTSGEGQPEGNFLLLPETWISFFGALLGVGSAALLYTK